MHFTQRVFFLCMLLAGSGCDQSSPGTGSESATLDPSTRWYTASQVTFGSQVFANNCAECHGSDAQGIVEDWRERLADGSFPPPPLNGSAHAWHHPRSLLIQVIDEGGVAFGGKMPGFANILNEEEKLAAIAFFQNFWSDEIYGNWLQVGGTD